MNTSQCTIESLKKFHCVENPEHLYETNKKFFDKYIELTYKEYFIYDDYSNEL